MRFPRVTVAQRSLSVSKKEELGVRVSDAFGSSRQAPGTRIGEAIGEGGVGEADWPQSAATGSRSSSSKPRLLMVFAVVARGCCFDWMGGW